ncbi:MAG: Uma2 family endonuclease [Lachnospiraceae bacterium]|nr:Uma2 family endonuclease [Lachnospiraceae bacterium]
MIKLFKYRTSGVREYWIVDPDRNRVMVYNFSSNNMSEYAFGDAIPSGIYPSFSICLASLDI